MVSLQLAVSLNFFANNWHRVFSAMSVPWEDTEGCMWAVTINSAPAFNNFPRTIFPRNLTSQPVMLQYLSGAALCANLLWVCDGNFKLLSYWQLNFLHI